MDDPGSGTLTVNRGESITIDVLQNDLVTDGFTHTMSLNANGLSSDEITVLNAPPSLGTLYWFQSISGSGSIDGTSITYTMSGFSYSGPDSYSSSGRCGYSTWTGGTVAFTDGGNTIASYTNATLSGTVIVDYADPDYEDAWISINDTGLVLTTNAFDGLHPGSSASVNTTGGGDIDAFGPATITQITTQPSVSEGTAVVESGQIRLDTTSTGSSDPITFEYEITDNTGATDTALVTVFVTDDGGGGSVSLVMDIDTDSNNNGTIEDTADDPIEHKVTFTTPAETNSPYGKRIFLNSDDDNKNGEPDYDDSTASGENDFAEITLTTKVDTLNNYVGYQLWLGGEPGIKLWAGTGKTTIASDRTFVADTGTPDTDPADDITWYVWNVTTAGATFPATIYAEGTATDRLDVYWRLRDVPLGQDGNAPTDDSEFVSRDTIMISVETIVWPNETTFNATEAAKFTRDWDGLKLEPGWTPEKSLEEIILTPTDVGEIRTLYPEVAGPPPIAQNGEGPDSYTTLEYASGFTLEVDVKFDSGYVQAQGQPQKLSFFANSGIKIWGIYEIAIFDTAKVWNLTGRSVDATSSDVSATGYSPAEKVSKLISGVAYGNTNYDDEVFKLLDETQSNQVEHLMEQHKDLFGSTTYTTMKITFKPGVVNDEFEVKVWIGNVLTYQDLSVTNGTSSASGQNLSAAASKKIRFQTHWDSGVKFKNMKISGPPQ